MYIHKRVLCRPAFSISFPWNFVCVFASRSCGMWQTLPLFCSLTKNELNCTILSTQYSGTEPILLSYPVYCSDCGLDNRWFLVRLRGRTIHLSSAQSAHASSGAHSDSYSMSNWVFPGGKAVGGVESSTHPHLVPRLRVSGNVRSLPHVYLQRAQGQLYFY